MKTYLITILLAVTFSAALQGQGKLTTYLNSLPLQSLDAIEKAELNHMRQEEKLARDVYKALFIIWKVPIFNNIAAAEQAHMDLIKVMLDRYKLTDPLPSEDFGVFADKGFFDLFVLLVIHGAQSLENAFTVGAFIEDLDIFDLQVALKKTDNRDIGAVYHNLMKGSRNHMRSFFGQLLSRKVTYKPWFLTTVELAAIVNSPRETRVVYDENGKPL